MNKEELLKKIDVYKRKENPLKDEYEAFIKNLTIPLDDRWEVFCEAPDEFKNSSSFIERFKFEKKLPGKRIDWNGNDFYFDRHQEVHMQNVIENLIENMEYQEDGDVGIWTRELIDEWKEEILAANLGSFTFDW